MAAALVVTAAAATPGAAGPDRAAPPTGASSGAAPSPSPAPRLRLVTNVSYTANLVHWVDNLAGTSVAKTLPSWRHAWRARFGPPTPEDVVALTEFARLRQAPVPSDAEVVNSSGCLPVESDVMSWHQRFLAAAMEASSPAELARSLTPPLTPDEGARLAQALDRFEPRFRQVWDELGHARAFEKRFADFMEKGPLPAYLDSLAAFFGVDAGQAPPMRVSFMALPANGPTHAEADGDHLLVEIRPADSPEDQIQVIAHEASHFLMRRVTAARMDDLAREAHARGEAGALVWRYMWEGIPTSLGQGLAEARLSPQTFSTAVPWYHRPAIDRFAKLIYPAVSDAVLRGRTLDGRLMQRMADVVRGSSMYREAAPAEFLMSSFFVAGDRLDLAVQALQGRLARSQTPPAQRFRLDDPRLGQLLRQYACLAGVALVTGPELAGVAALDGGLSLPPRAMRQAAERAGRGDGAILAGRRAGGGPVFVLVAPDVEHAAPVLEQFIKMKGLPSGVLDVPIARAAHD